MGRDHVLERCLAVRSGEQVMLLTDDGTDKDVVAGLFEGIGRLGATPFVARIPVPSLPGAEPPSSAAGRPGRVLHGIARERGDYMAPPDIEAGTAPVEHTAEGVVVIDADLLFMGIGPLPEPVVLHVYDGRMTAAEGAESIR